MIDPQEQLTSVPPRPVRVNFVLAMSTVVAALGGLLFGLDTAVIAGTTDSLTQLFYLSPAALGVTVSSALWGTIVGASISGWLGERLGRRDSLRIMAALYVISAVGCAFAWSWPALLFFRIVGGVGIGGSSVLGPMYIAEIAPAAWRGRLVGLFQINVVVGILFAYLSNYIIEMQNLGVREWRWQLGVPGLPAVIFSVALLYIPRSPRWLMYRERSQEAEACLIAVGEPDPHAELTKIRQAIVEEAAMGREKLLSRRYRLPLFLAVSMGLFCQLSGINAILYYLNDIFAAAGFTRLSGDLQAVVIGATNLLFTFLAMFVIDRVGRKFLLLVGSVGMAGALVGVAMLFHTKHHPAWLLWLLIGYAASFSFSEGAVMWVYIGEVFPTSVRAKGQGAGSLAHWMMNAIISGVFPVLAAQSRTLPFVFFALMMVLQFFVVLFIFPETRGVSLEDMQKKLATT
jgi:SP family arabinose:H+ symporter-like MFS transporter